MLERRKKNHEMAQGSQLHIMFHFLFKCDPYVISKCRKKPLLQIAYERPEILM